MRNAISRKQSSVDDEIETRLGFRLERQKLLEWADPPRMWFVIGEPALRRPLGRTEVMREQLQHLLNVIDEQPWITIQVVPISVGDHPLLDGSITAFRFAGGLADVVHQSTFSGGWVYVEDTESTRECFHAYDRSRSVPSSRATSSTPAGAIPMAPANASPTWRTSSYSNGANNNCVEVGLHANATDVRDTKSRTGGSIRYSRLHWVAFLTQLRSAGSSDGHWGGRP